jgi:hypothetical protein
MLSMRRVKESRDRLVFLGWLLPLVLLALPQCAFTSTGLGNEPDDPPPCEEQGCPPPPPIEEFKPGTDPSDAILCDIPKPLKDTEDGCATQQEADDLNNISLAEAATALVEGNVKSFALDFSDDAKLACDGRPKKIKFFGEFPDGYRVCINCGTQIGNGNEYATMAKACIAKCTDLVNTEGPIPAEGAAAYCAANARLATNHDPDMCYPGGCTGGGSSNLSWVDPRKAPEPVIWIDKIDTEDNGTNDLERTSATTGGMTIDFNAGAASAQTFANGGDGWVEFAAADGTDKVHVLGLRTSCANPANCQDTDPHIETVGFAIDLNSDGQVYVLEPGVTPGTFTVSASHGAYAVGERFRIRVTDNLNGTGSISYHRLVGGVEQPPFATNTAFPPFYPLRVDTTFRELGARISDVTIVRIK